MGQAAPEAGFWTRLEERAAPASGAARFWAPLQAALDLFAARPRQAPEVVARRLSSPRQGTYYVLKQPRDGAYLRLSEGDFELWSLAVSAVNGCGMCLDSHEAELKKHGVPADRIQAALRIAAVVNAVSRVLTGEEAVAA